MPESLQIIAPHAPAFLLVLSRMAGLFVFAPMLASAAVPLRIRILLAVALCLCVYPLIPPDSLAAWAGPQLVLALVSELAVGLVLGFAVLLPLIAMRMAGTLIGQQLGLDLAEVYHPDHGGSADVVGQLLLLTALTIFLLMDGHRALLSSLIGSFERIPPGGRMPDGQWLALLAGLLGSMVELAVRVAAPVLCLVFIEAATLGFVGRTIPQLNVLSAGFPLRIALGLAMLALVVGFMGHAFAGAMRETFAALARVTGL